MAQYISSVKKKKVEAVLLDNKGTQCSIKVEKTK